MGVVGGDSGWSRTIFLIVEMRLRLRNFQGDVRIVDVTTNTASELKDLARGQFRRTETDVTLLRLGKVISDAKTLDDSGLKENDIVVVAFGPLKKIESQKRGQDSSEAAAVADGSSGSSLDKPEVKAMLAHPEYRKAKEKFQSDPSKWETLYAHLIRIFPAASHFIINEKENLKRLMSQAEFGTMDEMAEEEAAVKMVQEVFTAQQMEDIDNLLSVAPDREAAIQAYLHTEKDLGAAIQRLMEG